MKIKVMKVKDTPEHRAYWELIEKNAAEASKWLEWMRGGSRAAEDEPDSNTSSTRRRTRRKKTVK